MCIRDRVKSAGIQCIQGLSGVPRRSARTCPHQAVALAGACANVQRPRQEALQLEIHGVGQVGEQLCNITAEYLFSLCEVPTQKAGARIPGKHTIPWQSLGEGVRQPMSPGLRAVPHTEVPAEIDEPEATQPTPAEARSLD